MFFWLMVFYFVVEFICYLVGEYCVEILVIGIGLMVIVLLLMLVLGWVNY